MFGYVLRARVGDCAESARCPRSFALRAVFYRLLTVRSARRGRYGMPYLDHLSRYRDTVRRVILYVYRLSREQRQRTASCRTRCDDLKTVTAPRGPGAAPRLWIEPMETIHNRAVDGSGFRLDQAPPGRECQTRRQSVQPRPLTDCCHTRPSASPRPSQLFDFEAPPSAATGVRTHPRATHTRRGRIMPHIAAGARRGRAAAARQ